MKYIIDVPEDRVQGDRLCVMGIMEDSLSHYLPTGIKATPYDESLDNETIAEKRGQEEAWEFAQRIIIPSTPTYNIGGITDDDLNDCYGINNPDCIISAMSYAEARAKYEAWKENKDKEELHVGDEVNVYDGKAVLLDKVVDGWFVMNENGTVETFRNGEISGKTGQHFDEVAELLKKLRESS